MPIMSKFKMKFFQIAVLLWDIKLNFNNKFHTPLFIYHVAYKPELKSLQYMISKPRTYIMTMSYENKKNLQVLSFSVIVNRVADTFVT